MNNELEKRLVEKYKNFFTLNQGIEKGKPFYPIAFGCECGDGWYDILDNLLYTISKKQNKINRTLRLNKIYWFISGKWLKSFTSQPLDIKITQIKEKFGGLSFYVDGATSEIYDDIHQAEKLSYCTCETCGSTEDVGQTSGWIITICKKCIDKSEHNKDLMHTWKPNKKE